MLRLRGRTQVGATLIDVLDSYADDLATAGGRLVLSGLHPDVAEQLRRSGKLTPHDDVHLYEAAPTLTESTLEAWRDALRWIRTTEDRGPEETDPDRADSRNHEKAPRAPVLPSRLSRPHP